VGLPRKPSEYCRDNVFMGASFQARFEAEESIACGYWTNVMWGTDYPHIEGTWKPLEDPNEEPMSHISLRYSYAGLPQDEVRAMLGLNASKV